MSEILAPVVNFLVVIFVLWYYGRKPTADYLASRSKNISDQIAEGERLSAEASKTLAHWEAYWKSSEAHAKQALEDAKQMVARIKETTIASARNEAERIRQDGKLVAQTEASRAKAGVGKELAEKTIQMATQYLRGHLEDVDRHRLVNEYVEKLANGTA